MRPRRAYSSPRRQQRAAATRWDLRLERDDADAPVVQSGSSAAQRRHRHRRPLDPHPGAWMLLAGQQLLDQCRVHKGGGCGCVGVKCSEAPGRPCGLPRSRGTFRPEPSPPGQPTRRRHSTLGQSTRNLCSFLRVAWWSKTPFSQLEGTYANNLASAGTRESLGLIFGRAMAVGPIARNGWSLARKWLMSRRAAEAA